MPVTPLVLNGIKLTLALGVGLGGHQIYGQLTPVAFADDGSYYFNSKWLLPNSRSDALKRNKAFYSESPLKSTDGIDQISWHQSYWRDDQPGGRYLDFSDQVPFREKLNTIGNLTTAEKADIYKRIKDHTLKLSMPCQSGTGWLLDFEIPEDTWNYPTKWFIATNLHVINKFRFRENPYKVELPITDETVALNVPRYYNNITADRLNSCEASIVNNTAQLILYTEEDSADAHRFGGGYGNRYNTQYWYNGSYPRWWQSHVLTYEPWSRTFSRVYTTTIDRPKLVYSAVNFLGDRYTVSGHTTNRENYFKDFGVMEVEFANADEARVMTNGVYDKYYRDIVHKTKGVYVTEEKKLPVNFFAEELMSRYNAEELTRTEKRYFIGGYPGSPSENLSFLMNQKFKTDDYNYFPYYHQYANLRPTESRLTYFRDWPYLKTPTEYNLRNKNGQVLVGHASLEAIDNTSDASKIAWNGKTLNGWGYNYLISNSFLGKGASGSMVLDQTGELLGLYRMYNDGLNYGFVEPLRGSWVVDDKGRIVLPGFDLLTGQGHNVSSYRTQLETHLPHVRSFLKSQDWKAR
ncbi:MIP family Ig-specific serine endopeptidase [Candidatus Mycoplasma haematominutum]|uniref:Conserved hypothetical prolipoprotein n=1 Tax=Candidatus Mycoplasma haematominutum 'Birmingham 1' TaxID=1116213 RepID=G8C3T3_9MOLU|nr:hypothetical protein [Candidatus Mycoplasma haematominutum]CCE66981.1 conserved hypothetical prolipoprotein [Candidatus Mycoplasma haematominutum 'Birmingham 1']